VVNFFYCLCIKINLKQIVKNYLLLKCFFDGLLDVRKGEVIKIIAAVSDTDRLRVSVIEYLTTGKKQTSRIEGVMMARPPVTLREPIIGRVKSSDIDHYNTYFEIEEGNIENNVFVRAGEKKKGQDALIDIFKNRLDAYVKICDPYVSSATIRLPRYAPSSIDVLVLTDKVSDLAQIKREMSNLNNKIIIKRGQGLHDRFILTRGEGWSVGHSLKDFGSKNSQLMKLMDIVDAESAFDDNWNQSSTLFP
jgi:hypothetical protein